MSIATKCTCGWSISGICRPTITACRNYIKSEGDTPDTQLPAEVKKDIEIKAKSSAANFNYYPGSSEFEDLESSYITGATAYAIKLNQAQQLLREADTQLSYISSFVDSTGPAMNLLSRIKTFLDGAK